MSVTVFRLGPHCANYRGQTKAHGFVLVIARHPVFVKLYYFGIIFHFFLALPLLLSSFTSKFNKFEIHNVTDTTCCL